mgnify:CR=1 FL=1
MRGRVALRAGTLADRLGGAYISMRHQVLPHATALCRGPSPCYGYSQLESQTRRGRERDSWECTQPEECRSSRNGLLPHFPGATLPVWLLALRALPYVPLDSPSAHL